MNGPNEDRLYQLLPAVYRVRDAEHAADTGHGEPLRALLRLIQEEADRLRDDIDGLYEDWFIETCAEWVVPYLGDLLGVRHLHPIESAGLFSLRAFVANTLRYRRRKGTAPVLEQLARDVTGWPARAVEFFERLATTQHLNHVRLHRPVSPDLRSSATLALVDGPFETITHTAEARRLAVERGRYNIPNVGLFLWRLQSYYLTAAAPRPVADPPDGRYTFSPLGNDLPLFNRPQTETEITHLAEPVNVPDRLRRRTLYDDLDAYRQALLTGGTTAPAYFGPQPVLQVFFDDLEAALPPEQILICDLSGWDVPGWIPPADTTGFGAKVSVDPERGRLAVLQGVPLPARLRVSYAYGFAADLGGGPYGREATLASPAGTDAWTATVAQHDPAAGFTTLAGALAAWAASDATEGVLTILDSATYAETLTISFTPGRSLVVQAADGRRPHLRLRDGSGRDLADLTVGGGTDEGTALTLNGLLIEGGLHVEAGSLERLTLLHCTLVPGRGLLPSGEPRRPDRPALTVAPGNERLDVTITASILGPIRMPEATARLTVTDSIVQSPLAGGAATRTPALVSGNLSPFPALTSATPTVQVQLGTITHTLTLAGVPSTLAEARDRLQAALQAADPDPAFAGARVVTALNRLILVPGRPLPVVVTTAGDDPTADELRLTGDARMVEALRSAGLATFPALSAPLPALRVAMNDRGPFVLTLDPPPTSVAEARDRLHTALRNADADPAFADALVANLDDALLVLPGTEATTVLLGTTPDDRTTLFELALDENRPALAADDAGTTPGPESRFIRSTVFGTVYVRALGLASESIFTHPATVVRRQTGCARFCSFAEGSRTPRRFRCQPDLALEGLVAETERRRTRVRLTPTFTATQYGQPGYAQLRRRTAAEIRTGAEDGAEMGAFNQLKEALREANLRTALDEYLRFGLESGIFFIT
ncbi:MAG: hypothetical protein KatS3mg043_1337 [Rhodothermaceae bacterium]|nr:MAG: hypothetical protein KatS3mg043_1337 [Rhodothermaceae bacterium]